MPVNRYQYWIHRSPDDGGQIIERLFRSRDEQWELFYNNGEGYYWAKLAYRGVNPPIPTYRQISSMVAAFFVDTFNLDGDELAPAF